MYKWIWRNPNLKRRTPFFSKCRSRQRKGDNWSWKVGGTWFFGVCFIFYPRTRILTSNFFIRADRFFIGLRLGPWSSVADMTKERSKILVLYSIDSGRISELRWRRHTGKKKRSCLPFSIRSFRLLKLVSHSDISRLVRAQGATCTLNFASVALKIQLSRLGDLLNQVRTISSYLYVHWTRV